MTNTPKVVMVTGGAGFLGQHIVKLLHERGSGIKEVRVFDFKKYEQNLEFNSTFPMRTIQGDLRNKPEIAEAVRGVDTVIHTAAVVSFGTFPDFKAMEEVNVQGTANLIDACIQENVSNLVLTSTIDVVIGYDEIYDGDESLAIPDKLLFPGYPDTKHRAEGLVIEAHGKALASGQGQLSTLVLRPNVMYGEGDPFFVTSSLKTAHKRKGSLPRIGTGEAKFQQAYVGNMAWGHVVAADTLSRNPDVGGQVYFITDDTPLQNPFDFMKVFLEARGFTLSDRRLSYPLIYSALYVIETILWLISPFKQINISASLCSIIYINKTFYFNRTKAETNLGYKPIFSPQESIEKAKSFYKIVALD